MHRTQTLAPPHHLRNASLPRSRSVGGDVTAIDVRGTSESNMHVAVASLAAAVGALVNDHARTQLELEDVRRQLSVLSPAAGAGSGGGSGPTSPLPAPPGHRVVTTSSMPSKGGSSRSSSSEDAVELQLTPPILYKEEKRGSETILILTIDPGTSTSTSGATVSRKNNQNQSTVLLKFIESVDGDDPAKTLLRNTTFTRGTPTKAEIKVNDDTRALIESLKGKPGCTRAPSPIPAFG